MTSRSPRPLTGNAAAASKDTRGWFLGHFMPGDDNPLRNSDVEVKWFTHAKGETRPEWSPASRVRTLNILLRGRFVLLFPEEEVLLANEGDFVLFGPDIAHLYRCGEESLVLTIRWPSIPVTFGGLSPSVSSRRAPRCTRRSPRRARLARFGRAALTLPAPTRSRSREASASSSRGSAIRKPCIGSAPPRCSTS